MVKWCFETGCKKTVIIGIDGAPHGLIRGFTKGGVMPNLAELLEQGSFIKMESAIPEVSSVSWSSIITGDNAGEHGVYGFTDFIPGTYDISFPDFNSLKTKPYWERNGGETHVVINVPMTYPAREMNGFLVAGFVAPDLERATFPREHVRTLKRMDYRTDVDASKAKESMTLFMSELMDTLEARIKTYRHFWNAYKWGSFTLVFTGSDRLEHVLWNAYEDRGHELHEDFLHYFARVDEVIGEINAHLSENDQLIVLSDHGMEGVGKDVNINAALVEEGFLSLEENGKKLRDIKASTQAFAMEPSRIYINKRGRFPRGSVSEKDAKCIADSLAKAFGKRRYIKRAYRKDELYSGNEIRTAPEVVLLSTPGFNLRAKIPVNGLYESPLLKGHHTQDDAFLFVKQREEVQENGITVEDVAPLILR